MCLFPEENQQPVLKRDSFFRRKSDNFSVDVKQKHSFYRRKSTKKSLRSAHLTIIILLENFDHSTTTHNNTQQHTHKTQHKTHKHTNTQTHKHTNTQTHKHTNTETQKHRNTQPRNHTTTQPHNHTNTQTNSHFGSSRCWTSAPQRLEPRWSYHIQIKQLFGIRKFANEGIDVRLCVLGGHFWHLEHDCVQQPAETAETASVVSTAGATSTPHASAERTAHWEKVFSRLGLSCPRSWTSGMRLWRLASRARSSCRQRSCKSSRTCARKRG